MCLEYSERNGYVMRQRKLFTIVICVLLLLCTALTTIAVYQNRWYKTGEITDAYIFPKYEGERSLAWEEAVEFYQVPDTVLKSMSTKGLVETCLSYPLFASNMIFSNVSMYSGFKSTIREFNGLTELLNREDAGRILLNVYKTKDLGLTILTDEYPIFRLKYFEYIMSLDEILHMLSYDERNELIEVCFENLIIKDKTYDDMYSRDSTILIIAKIYSIDNDEFNQFVKSNPKVNTFLEYGIFEAMSEEEVGSLLNLIGVY